MKCMEDKTSLRAAPDTAPEQGGSLDLDKIKRCMAEVDTAPPLNLERFRSYEINHDGRALIEGYPVEMAPMANHALRSAAPALLAECRRLTADNARLRLALSEVCAIVTSPDKEFDNNSDLLSNALQVAKAALLEGR